jgi:hypothetical protein
MSKQAGLWIDHRKAVIVLITDEGEKAKNYIRHGKASSFYNY